MNMFRVVCITLYFLFNLYYDVKFNYVCMAAETHNNRSVRDVLQHLKEYLGEVRNYIGVRKGPKKESRTLLKNDFVKLLERGLKNIQPPINVKPAPKQTELIEVGKPIRKPSKPSLFLHGMDAADVIVAYGYTGESHSILASDGYILNVQRVLPNAKVAFPQSVILHHGLLCSCEDWLVLGHDALPYMLSNLGYDVWLLNARGNKYSRHHNSRSTKSFDFWDFSWHEMGVYDLSATITYISRYTNNAPLYYIGHSMGATALLVLLSTMPEYNRKLKSAVFLAPLAFMHNSRSPFSTMRNITSIMTLINDEEFMMSKEYPERAIQAFCDRNDKVCENYVLFLANGGKDILDADLMENVLSHIPAGGSVKTLIHYMQLTRGIRFRMFDYGVLTNMMVYNRKTPPKYNLKGITVPISMFTSESDLLASMKDITTLIRRLRTTRVHHIVNKEDFGHMSFVWSKRAPALVYDLVINELEISARKTAPRLITNIMK